MNVSTQAMDAQQRRFGWISIAAILVSFVHMAAALVLFSRESYVEQAAAVLMTALIDVATWGLSGYLDYARTRKRGAHFTIGALFIVALLISMFLNGAYLYANRPAETELPEWMSIGIAATFAIFVPCLIGVAALIRGEVDADKIAAASRRPRLAQYRALIKNLAKQLRQARRDGKDAGQLRAALLAMEATARDLRESAASNDQAARSADQTTRAQLATIARLEAQLDERTRTAREQHASIDQTTRELRDQLAHERASLADAQRIARERDTAAREAERQAREADQRARDYAATVEQLRAELAARPATMPPSRAQIITYVREQMQTYGRSRSEVARELGFTESTVRGWLDTATNGHASEVLA